MRNGTIPAAPAGWHLAATGHAWAEYRRALRGPTRRVAIITVHESGSVYGKGLGGHLRQYESLAAAAAALNPHCEES